MTAIPKNAKESHGKRAPRMTAIPKNVKESHRISVL